jgi:cellulose synthase/poly-beta-1,6-N-acetylglucosamine synthase-like glycosyltransferase
MGAMVVCPGCATIFASSLFKQITIPEGTLAEDMDLTFLIHRKKLGDIVYAPEAEVISEDPHSLADFVKQVRRWYTGFWQVILKYDIPWGGQMLDLEVGLIAIEGLFNGLFVVVLLTATWWLWWTNPIYVIIPLLIDLVLFMLPTMVWTMIRRERWRLPQYLLRTYLLRTISALVFVWGFLTVVFRFDQVMTWFSPKRKLLRERLVHGTT